jgi:hypothetical protein
MFNLLASLILLFFQKDTNNGQMVDCEVSEWSNWSECKKGKTCNHGIQERQREIKRNSLNGGAECPKLREKRKCMLGAFGCKESSLKSQKKYFY